MDAHSAGGPAPRRILVTTDAVGGVWTYCLQLARALAGPGEAARPGGSAGPGSACEVLLAAVGPPPRAGQREAAAAIPGLRLAEKPGRLEWMEEPWEEVREAGRWLLALEADFRPQVVHLNQYAFGRLAWRAPVLLVGHSCVYSWYRAVRGGAPPASWARYREEVRAGLRGADLVTAPTRAMLEALRDHYGPFRSAGVAYNGRAAGAFRPRRKEPFIFSAGRLWDEAKNVRLLAQAAPGVAWPVLAAGPLAAPGAGSPEEGGERPAGHRPQQTAPGVLRLLGELEPAAMAGWLGRAAIFALPARYEPFGLSALEAGLAGCALVLGDIPSLREVWGEAACFVPPGDARALAGCLNRLIGDAALRAELGRRARRRALRYGARRMARRYLDLYGRLLREGRR